MNLQKIKMQISKSMDRFLDFAEDKKKDKNGNKLLFLIAYLVVVEIKSLPNQYYLVLYPQE